MFRTTIFSFTSVILGLSLFASPLTVNAQSINQNNSHQLQAIQKRFGLDPNLPLTARMKEASPQILEKFRQAGMSPVPHPLTKDDSMKVVKAFQGLPMLHQQVLKEHLLAISFLDNMPNTALTSTVNPDDSVGIFTITFRAEILKQNVSEWLTQKELSYFSGDSSGISISIDAGDKDAILYVLLHEATHVVDGSLGIFEDDLNSLNLLKDKPLKAFANNIWLDRVKINPKYQDSLSNILPVRRGGHKLPIKFAPAIYQFAAEKPFASLYSIASRNEDIAEFLTLYHFTDKLNQPFKIRVLKNEKIIHAYEPMKYKHVASRRHLMKYFYK